MVANKTTLRSINKVIKRFKFIQNKIITKRRWPFLLMTITILLSLTSFILFRPGFFSPDSIDQFGQSYRNMYTDWHPATMAILWHYLVQLTGSITSMLAFQLTIFWTSITLISLYIYKKTNSRIKSLLPIFLSILPPVFLLTGVIWKDVGVAFSLLFAMALSLYIGDSKNSRLKYALLIICLCFMAYANNIRHVVWVALIPLLLLIFTKFTKNYLKVGALTLVTLLMFFSFGSATNALFKVKKTHPETQVMLDDVKELADINEIKDSNLSQNSKEYIIKVKDRCQTLNVKVSALFRCSTFAEFNDFNNVDHIAMSAFWKQTILSNPIKYFEFRTKTYLEFIFAPNGLYIMPHPKIFDNLHNITDTNKFTRFVYQYFNFTYRDFRFVFTAYFWILFNLAILVYVLIKKKMSPYYLDLILILLSGLIYVLSFYPSSLSPDFRFYYWTVLTILFSCSLILADVSKNQKSQTK